MKLWVLLAVAAASLALGYLIWAPGDDDPRPARPAGARPLPSNDPTAERTAPAPGALATETTMAFHEKRT